MKAHTEGRTNGAALRPLSGEQIRTLVLLAKRTFETLMEAGALGDAAEFDCWRHEQCMQSVERPGLRECRNEDFLPLRAHLHGLLGEALRSLGREDAYLEQERLRAADLERHEVEPRTWALAKLQLACRNAADVMPEAMRYAEGFLWNRRHVAIDDADDKMLWQAYYLVERKARQLRESAARATA